MGTIDTSTTIKAATDSITNITATLANYMQEDLGRGSISWDYFCNNPDWTAYGVLAGFSILMGIIVVVLLVFIWGVAKHVSIRCTGNSLTAAAQLPPFQSFISGNVFIQLTDRKSVV